MIRNRVTPSFYQITQVSQQQRRKHLWKCFDYVVHIVLSATCVMPSNALKV